ncbi:MAG: LysM peptidoglycan-binding domain-containing protein [Ruminococcaceae bacterium]|nr:LysM peptidoglycan-binding domain-containing protein [Oscillospiraceae bacterium]
MVIYVVQPGDTLESIAREYGVPLSRLISQNELTDTENLAVGQTIVILYAEEVYTVRSGDTLASIANSYGTTINNLLQNNPQLMGKTEVFEGQTLIISYDTQKLGNIAVNGYIYPFVDRDTLIRTLPYLTYLTLFTYGFMPNGELVDRGITEFGLNEDEIISLSREYGAAPIMHLSTLGENGLFNSELGNALLNNPEAQNVLIQNIVSKMIEKNYYGLDIDFEYLDTANRDLYTTFLSRVQQAMSENGFILITALIPKASSDQPGALYESHDYGGIGAVSDYVLLMTYEWGYAFGPPMAVAPLNEVERVVRYAVTEIPSDKIFLGVPNYAYDWPLPYERGKTKAESLTNVDAVNLAVKTGSVIMFDEYMQTPYFFYNLDGVRHVVWFDDARSIEEKLNLVSKYNLYGASYWNVMKWFPQNWLVLNSMYNIDKIL